MGASRASLWDRNLGSTLDRPEQLAPPHRPGFPSNLKFARLAARSTQYLLNIEARIFGILGLDRHQYSTRLEHRPRDLNSVEV